jgi:isopentenyldiphosphate isomerase
MQRVHIMIRTRHETSSHEKILFPKVKTASSCDHPICAACRFAKPTRRNPGTIKGIDSSNRDLSQGDMQPGTKVSIDQ